MVPKEALFAVALAAAPGGDDNPYAAILELLVVLIIVLAWVTVWVASTFGHAALDATFSRVSVVVLALIFHYAGIQRGVGRNQPMFAPPSVGPSGNEQGNDASGRSGRGGGGR
jgi:hypothetical protein